MVNQEGHLLNQKGDPVMKCDGVMEFYAGRIRESLHYGFNSGSIMLDMAQRAILYDDCLEADEAVSLLRMVSDYRMKLYGEHWQDMNKEYEGEDI